MKQIIQIDFYNKSRMIRDYSTKRTLSLIEALHFEKKLNKNIKWDFLTKEEYQKMYDIILVK